MSFLARKINRVKYKLLMKGVPDLHYDPEELLNSGFKSQYGQDKFVFEEFFKGQKTGFFLDIGAHDGVTYSNSAYFESVGWDGVAVEPNPSVYSQLNRNRNCQKFNGCIASESGNVNFRQISGYSEMLSGVVETYDNRHISRINNEILDKGGSYTDISVPCLNFRDLVSQYKIERINFLSIDVEGGELEILHNIDFGLVVIDVIAVENNYGNAQIPKIMKVNGFEPIVRIGDEIYTKTLREYAK
jgi:FkbM family methyltransferase